MKGDNEYKVLSSRRVSKWKLLCENFEIGLVAKREWAFA